MIRHSAPDQTKGLYIFGKTPAHYEILSKLGESGMGVVWKARDAVLDRKGAIKILPETCAADAARLRCFEREAKLLASLNHPCIATVHGLHEADGVHFIAMVLVPGTRGGEIPLRRTEDGRELFVRRWCDGVPARDYRLDIETGERRLWRELIPTDPAGVRGIVSWVPTPDGRGYAYSWFRGLEKLYWVSDLD